MANLKWTDSRCEQLKILTGLLYRASYLNNSSGIIENIKYCIDQCDFIRDAGFIDFLNNLAIADREGVKHGGH